MQSDIVQRLRDLHSCQDVFSCDWQFLSEAAAEIERNRAEITRLTEALRKAEEREKALREVLAEISDLHGEINPCNYDNDDACELNRQFCYALTISSAALKEQPHADA